jgi:murein DD-endopeptidase MepM/ murein hydrolase activator NlpD
MYHAPVKGEGRERRDELGNFNKAYRTQPHRGSDWGFKNGSAGKPVYAVADGVVSENFWTDALGHCITVKNTHDEVFVLFAHLEEKSPVKKGTKVIGGETELGKIGNTGSASAGAHLHAAASKSPKPHLASYGALLDLFKLIDADKPKPATTKPKADTPVKKAPAKKPATKKVAK